MVRNRAALLPALLLIASPLAAQQAFRFAPHLQPELRIESVVASSPALLAGAGVNVPLGYLLRIGPSVAAGRTFGDSGATTLRGDFIARFLTDPFHEGRWGFYGGGGLAVVWTDGARTRQALALVAGADFPGRGGWRPALEFGLGGGARVALVARPVRRAGR